MNTKEDAKRCRRNASNFNKWKRCYCRFVGLRKRSVVRTPQGVEQARKGSAELRDISVDWTSWEGWQAESWTSSSSNSERAPAEVHFHQPRFLYGDSAGATLGVTVARRPTFRLPPSQLVRPTGAFLLLFQTRRTITQTFPPGSRRPPMR